MQVANHYATRPLQFVLSTLARVAAVVRKMLKTRVTLGNISRVSSNLIKRLISVMFKDCLPPPAPQCSCSWHSHFLYFLFSSPITAASRLNFCSLALSVWSVSWYVFSIGKSLLTGHLRIVLAFAIPTIAPVISESLLGNTPVTMAFQKCLSTFSS